MEHESTAGSDVNSDERESESSNGKINQEKHHCAKALRERDEWKWNKYITKIKS